MQMLNLFFISIEALQDIRIKHRWQAIDLKNQELTKAKKQGKIYTENVLRMEIALNNY